MDKWWLQIQQQSFIQQLVLWARRNTFLKVPIYDIVKVFLDKSLQRNLHQQASAIAFSLTLSVFPAIIFLFTLIPYIPIPDLDQQLKGFIWNFLPHSVYNFSVHILDEILREKSVDLWSFALAMFFAGNGVLELMDTFNHNYAYSGKRSYLIKRLLAAGVTLMYMMMLIFAAFVNITMQLFINNLATTIQLNENYIYYLLLFFRYVLVFLLFLFFISFIYYLSSKVKAYWRFFSIGAIVATCLIILGTELFSVYLSNFASYNKVYGSIGTALAMLFWLYLLAWVLILGFEINATIATAKIERKLSESEKYALLDSLSLQTRKTKKSNQI